MKDKIKSTLGYFVQQEDDGTYTSFLMLDSLHNENQAEDLCVVMAMAINEYFANHGINLIIDDKEIN